MGTRRDSGARRVVVIGGGASGTLTAVQLLRRAPAGLVVTVVEPRGTLGQGAAFGTAEPWHRINVPAITMTGLPEEPDHFRAFAGVAADAYPPRRVFGAYLGALLADARAGSAGELEHIRSRAVEVRDAPPDGAPLLVRLADGATLEADAVVLATGNELPRPPAFLRPLADSGDARMIANPWAAGALDAVAAGETVGIVGMGHTALDLAASALLGRGAARVVAVSRHAETPRVHEDPWRPRPPEPAFSVEEFATWADKPAEARRQLEAYPLGWRQALDSTRPIHRELWLAMTEDERRAFLAGHRRAWEIHRSRLGPEMGRTVAGWVSDGHLELLAAADASIEARADGLRLRTDAGEVLVHHILLATGPDESPASSPLLARLVADGLARPGSCDLGIDVHPYDYRVRDAGGGEGRPLFALGPIIRGSVWETIAVPEIRAQAARIAELVLAGG